MRPLASGGARRQTAAAAAALRGLAAAAGWHLGGEGAVWGREVTGSRARRRMACRVCCDCKQQLASFPEYEFESTHLPAFTSNVPFHTVKIECTCFIRLVASSKPKLRLLKGL
jgi:hypothetical protein